jgi:hypothetical protein
MSPAGPGGRRTCRRYRRPEQAQLPTAAVVTKLAPLALLTVVDVEGSADP